MQKFGVQMELEVIREARKAWSDAYAEFTRTVDPALDRLVLEAVANRMSVAQISRWSGLPHSSVQHRMRKLGLKTRFGSTVAIAHEAAKVLQDNARLLGIEPKDLDLTSPLAYLPMGAAMKARIEAAAEGESE